MQDAPPTSIRSGGGGGGSKTDLVYGWVFWPSFLHLMIVEVFLSGVPGFLGFTNWLIPNSTFMLIVQCFAFLVSLLIWILISCFDQQLSAPASEIKGRGSIVFGAARIYFFATTVIHAFLMVAWIVWVSRYGDLAPPFNFTNNFGPLVVIFQICLAQFLVLFVALFFFIYDIRNQSSVKAFRQIERANHALNAKFSEAFSTAR